MSTEVKAEPVTEPKGEALLSLFKTTKNKEELQQKLRELIDLKRKDRTNDKEAPPKKRIKLEESNEPSRPIKREPVKKVESKAESATKAETKTPVGTPTKNKKSQEDRLQFSLFDFSSGKPKPQYLVRAEAKEKSRRGDKALKAIQREEELLKNISVDDTTDATPDVGEAKWNSLFEKASGVKVLDDAKLIKKKEKQKEKKRDKSAKEWRQRSHDVKLTQKEKQQKRKDNISNHMKERKLRRLGKLPSKKPEVRHVMADGHGS
ncbi:hypothetical protein PROFUN_00854 [Planoprotostelium fungivorum]|uniref:Ribosomal RNA-processing protein 14/surfeit locus protein 6 C-terminal domain-containing protein n=1 Tax=Planoprotostelium fungivorum TaxID=1890364 RepID=A0A2P6P063_9EUKA|nr:hypothetical protein PROFUN_00854 [Planoprotostelium fungivorum]